MVTYRSKDTPNVFCIQMQVKLLMVQMGKYGGQKGFPYGVVLLKSRCCGRAGHVEPPVGGFMSILTSVVKTGAGSGERQ